MSTRNLEVANMIAPVHKTIEQCNREGKDPIDWSLLQGYCCYIIIIYVVFLDCILSYTPSNYIVTGQ